MLPIRLIKLYAFRVQLIAAPLKRDDCQRYVRRVGGFPRSIDRGSIEAGCFLYGLLCENSFPRSIDRGSIEATRLRRWGSKS